MNTAELKKRAEAATPGPWHRMANKDFGPISQSEDQSFGMFIDCGSAHSDEDANYIAAANPAAILKLLAINAELVDLLKWIKENPRVHPANLEKIIDAALAKAEGGEL